jgi:hypothetical protein
MTKHASAPYVVAFGFVAYLATMQGAQEVHPAATAAPAVQLGLPNSGFPTLL